MVFVQACQGFYQKKLTKEQPRQSGAEKSFLYGGNKFARVDLDARSHGRSDNARSDVLAFGRRGFRFYNRVHQSIKVLLQLLRAERSFADG